MSFKDHLNKRYVQILGFFLLFTLAGLLKTSMFVSERIAGNADTLRIRYFFINEMTGSYTILLLIPFLIWFVKNFPIRKNNILSIIPAYFMASIIFGACHTGLMWLSRKLIYNLFGLGEFYYGNMWERLYMEYHHQIITFIAFICIYYFIVYVKNNQDEKLKRVKLEEALTKARLQTLQMQLNPHFLFNTLNMISSIMYKNVKIADSMIANLSDLLRETLKKQDSEFHTLNEEIKILSLYLEIMEARFSEKLKVEIDIDKETKTALVPGFILQPIVENSIKYAMDDSGNIKIKIKTKKLDDQLNIIIEDKGPGIETNHQNSMSRGLGISNIIERFDKLFNNDYEFKIENLENSSGLQVIIYIPFRKNGE